MISFQVADTPLKDQVLAIRPPRLAEPTVCMRRYLIDSPFRKLTVLSRCATAVGAGVAHCPPQSHHATETG